jgi:AcrR family transcriptional regulator
MTAMPRPAKLPRPISEAKPRTKPAEVRREELLDSAERLFLEKGLAATSVDEIVSQADVAKGTFYLHFASKEALVIGLQERYLVRCFAVLEKALARRKPDDYRGRLRTWIQSNVDFFIEHVALHDIVFHEFRSEAHKPSPDVAVFASLIDLLRDGAAAGAFDLSDPRLSAWMLLHGLHAASDAVLEAEKAGARKAIVKQLETFALRVVGAP